MRFFLLGATRNSGRRIMKTGAESPAGQVRNCRRMVQGTAPDAPAVLEAGLFRKSNTAGVGLAKSTFWARRYAASASLVSVHA